MNAEENKRSGLLEQVSMLLDEYEKKCKCDSSLGEETYPFDKVAAINRDVSEILNKNYKGLCERLNGSFQEDYNEGKFIVFCFLDPYLSGVDSYGVVMIENESLEKIKNDILDWLEYRHPQEAEKIYNNIIKRHGSDLAFLAKILKTKHLDTLRATLSE